MRPDSVESEVASATIQQLEGWATGSKYEVEIDTRAGVPKDRTTWLVTLSALDDRRRFQGRSVQVEHTAVAAQKAYRKALAAAVTNAKGYEGRLRS